MQTNFGLKTVRAGCCALLFAFIGCSSGEKLYISEIPETADPSVEITRLQTNMEQAKQKQADVLAPQHFKESKKALNEAIKLRSENRSNKEILTAVAEGDGYLNKANEVTVSNQAHLGEVISARSAALATQGPNPVGEFQEADSKFLEITASMEKGKSPIQEQDKMALIQDYRQAELKGVQQASMGEASRVIQEAKNEGAKKWAPNLLTQTEQQMTQLNDFIKHNPKNAEEINSKAGQFKAQADQLLRVTRQAKVLEAGNPEDVALRMDKQKSQVASLRTEEAMSREILERKNQQVASLQGESDLNARFNAIRSKFSPEEADVLRTEGKIVIRLKGLHFPSAGKNIPSRDFALLNKVGSTLKEFEGSAVMVEGHTDSKGSETANLKLSEKRAEAVKDYLVANQAVSEGKVMAEGKGFSRPIASNRTKEGRAQNRRVDIMIDTQA